MRSAFNEAKIVMKYLSKTGYVLKRNGFLIFFIKYNKVV